MTSLPLLSSKPSILPALVTAAGEQAGIRFLEFFASTIRNLHTRRAYGRAIADFLGWCTEHSVPSIAAVQPLHVGAWIELQTRERAAPTVKLRLAATRHLFDWLVMGQVIPLIQPRRYVGRHTACARARRRCSTQPRLASCSPASIRTRRSGCATGR